jgi:cytochrome d ubiquinol oxidase subunit II
VWLIFVLVATFGAFPMAFAAICQALWLPLLLALGGIVFRGAGYALRSNSSDDRRQQFAWDVVFAVGSTAAPFFLGASVGALASGKLMLTDDGRFDGNFLTGWLSPMSVFSGFFVVVMCTFLAAVFLAREASGLGDAELTRVWRQRAMRPESGWAIIAGRRGVRRQRCAVWDGFRQRYGRSWLWP